MNKKLLLLLLFSHFCFSQEKGNKVVYNLVVGEDKELDNSPVADYFNEAKKNAKYITFSLDYNDDSMLFYENKKMNGDNNDTTFSSAFSGVEGKYYKEKKSNFVLKEVNNKFGRLIIKTVDNINWTVTKETKIIQDYLCYKATAVVSTKNQKGKFKRTIMAWFCPKIPVSFGPKGYGGLPGLIMEFQDRNIVIGAIKIDFNVNLKKIELTKKGKLITEQEYNKLIENFAKKMKDENK